MRAAFEFREEKYSPNHYSVERFRMELHSDGFIKLFKEDGFFQRGVNDGSAEAEADFKMMKMGNFLVRLVG
ncbi:MAG: hypothetical protein IH881_16130 [Myxococcales bacterium]|nr:hypothetical protein [Myxococcales bacterium]